MYLTVSTRSAFPYFSLMFEIDFHPLFHLGTLPIS